MSTLSDLLAEHTNLTAADADHVQRLVGEWQLLSDLSFADLLLWIPVDTGFLCVAQVRPTTGPTAYQDDLVEEVLSAGSAKPLDVAFSQGRICREPDPEWRYGVPVRREVIPVRHRGRIIALLGRDINLKSARSPSQLELAYLQSAGELSQMVADGSFPPSGPTVESSSSGPRAGDGLLRLDPRGVVVYASPNALSAYRRLGVTGNLVDSELAPLTRAFVTDPFDAAEIADRINQALSGHAALRIEVEAPGATVLFRALPLRPKGNALGALVLVRDVTEVRHRDRQLMSKDATIREIHHRVKNNLQTVAALLRLQARRLDVTEAKAALEESVRRVSSIALVHETLSQSLDEQVNFDDIVDSLLSLVLQVAVPESEVFVRRDGSFGELPAETATPLAMILNELMQNAVVHAFSPGQSGQVVVHADRLAKSLTVTVTDDGSGFPEGVSVDATDRLGLHIVRTLIKAELGGTIELGPGPERGTRAVIIVPLAKRV